MAERKRKRDREEEEEEEGQENCQRYCLRFFCLLPNRSQISAFNVQRLTERRLHATQPVVAANHSPAVVAGATANHSPTVLIARTAPIRSETDMVLQELSPLVRRHWLPLRRNLRAMDVRRTGMVTPMQLLSCLRRYGVILSAEAFYHVHSHLDPDLAGVVPVRPAKMFKGIVYAKGP